MPLPVLLSTPSVLKEHSGTALSEETITTALGHIKEVVDPVTWAETNLEFTTDDWQGGVLRSSSRWIVMVCARQVGKSTIVALKVVHMAVTRPDSMILVMAPALRQSRELMAKIKTFLRMVDADMDKDAETEVRLKNGSRIVSLPGGADTIRGYSSVDLLVIDEAAFASDKLYYAVYPMVQISRGQIVLLSSAYITNGFFYEIWHGSDPRWEKYRITAFECPRYDPDELEEIQNHTPADQFKCEYLAEFVDPEGAVFTVDQIDDAFDDSVPVLYDESGRDLMDDEVEVLM